MSGRQVRVTFKWEAFRRDIGAQWWEERRPWRDIAREIGVSPSTLTRISQGKTQSVETVARLLKWLGRKFEDYTA